MRVVFDTNILVLNFIGTPASDIIDAALSDFPEEQLSFFYSEDTMQEYHGVLTSLAEERPAFFFSHEIEAFLGEIKRHGRPVYPTEILDACSHEPDNRFLECAVAAQAAYIVTVNTEHFPTMYQLPNHKVIRTIPPGQFQKILFGD